MVRAARRGRCSTRVVQGHLETVLAAQDHGASAILAHSERTLRLSGALSKIDRYRLLVIDDIGYVKRSEAESSVLFELIAHRYEAGSLLITSNQPFSSWGSIFPDDMMAVAAVDGLIHHAHVVELSGHSYRKRGHAAQRGQTKAGSVV